MTMHSTRTSSVFWRADFAPMVGRVVALVVGGGFGLRRCDFFLEGMEMGVEIRFPPAATHSAWALAGPEVDTGEAWQRLSDECVGITYM